MKAQRNRQRSPLTARRTIAAGAALLLAAACGGGGSETVSLTYATGGAPPPNEMQIAIFDDAVVGEGILENHGEAYDLDMIATAGTPEAQSLLVAGQADFATLAFSTIALTVQQEAVPGGISIVAGHFVDGVPDYVSNAYLVLEDSGIETAQDLVGRTVGVNAVGSAVDIFLRVWLLENGIDPDNDVNFVEVGFGAMGTALREGRVDLASMVQPFQSMELGEGGVRPLFDAREAAGGENAAIAVVARNSFLEEHPEAARAFLADWVAGLQWLTDEGNRDEAISIISNITGTPEDVLGLFYGLSGDDYFRDPQGCPNVEALQVGVDSMVLTGYLDAGLELAPLVDTSFLPGSC